MLSGTFYLPHKAGPFAPAVGSITAAVSSGRGSGRQDPHTHTHCVLALARPAVAAGVHGTNVFRRAGPNPVANQPPGWGPTTPSLCRLAVVSHSCCSGQLLQHCRRLCVWGGPAGAVWPACLRGLEGAAAAAMIVAGVHKHSMRTPRLHNTLNRQNSPDTMPTDQVF